MKLPNFDQDFEVQYPCHKCLEYKSQYVKVCTVQV